MTPRPTGERKASIMASSEAVSGPAPATVPEIQPTTAPVTASQAGQRAVDRLGDAERYAPGSADSRAEVARSDTSTTASVGCPRALTAESVLCVRTQSDRRSVRAHRAVW